MFGGQQPTTASFSSSDLPQDETGLLNLRQSSTFHSPHSASLMAHLSSVDLFLSPATYLPVAAKFATHPDRSSNIDIPVAVTYSDYRQISGVEIAFHIQKFINGTLVLDITASSAIVQ